MSMTDLTDKIVEHNKGVQAYIECMEIANGRLKEVSELSSAYFLLKYAAGKFVHTFDDQPLLSSRAEEEYENFKSYVDKLSELETATDAQTKFDILNKVAIEIANHKLQRSAV